MRTATKILLGSLFALALVLLLGALTYESSSGVLRQNRIVTHTYEVLRELDSLFDLTQEAESGMRGYLLTGREDYLAPYHTARETLHGRMQDLRKLVSDNPPQVQATDQFEELLAHRLDTARERVELRRTSGLDAVLPTLTGAGKQSMDAVRAQVAHMKQVETDLLATRGREFSARGRRLLGTFAALMGVTAALLAVFFVLVRRDLAARQRFAATLAANERRFRNLLESAPDAMVLTGAGGDIALVNSAFERCFGCDRQQAIGQPLRRFLEERPPDAVKSSRDDGSAPVLPGPDAPPAEPAGAAHHLEAIQSSLPGTRFEGLRADGTRFPAEVTFSPLSTDPGDGEGPERGAGRSLAAIRDDTERRQAEEKIRGFSEDLARSNSELERFAYVASHDLQEPLRMVSSYTQLLSRRYKGKLGADADEFITYAVDGATRMQTLINDLLAYSRVGSKPKEFAAVNCEQVLANVLHDLQRTLETRGARVEHDPLPTVLGDAVQLGQLFQNLLGNATKFSRPDAPPRVEVRVLRRSKGWWRFAVTDNGIGIDPQYFERIFLVFQRLHHKQDYPGTGIGLAICKRIVERHGGQLWVESEPGKGSSFLFTLPAPEV